MFLSILVFYSLIIEKGLGSIQNSYTLKKRCIEKGLENIELLVFGNSEANYGINPEVINNKSCNVANSSQDLYFDNLILNKYIDDLPNLKTVIFPVSYFSLYYNLENTEEAWRKYFYSYFYGIKSKTNMATDIRNYSLTFLYTPTNSLKYITQGFKVNLTENNDERGFYRAIKKTDGSGNAERQKSYIKEKYLAENIELINKSIEKLKNKNINTVFVMLPVSEAYFKQIDMDIYMKTDQILKLISDEKEVSYYNYIMGSFKDEDFVDGADHLNEKAAKRFSEMLKLEIN